MYYLIVNNEYLQVISSVELARHTVNRDNISVNCKNKKASYLFTIGQRSWTEKRTAIKKESHLNKEWGRMEGAVLLATQNSLKLFHTLVG